jgi:hypothetical protein
LLQLPTEEEKSNVVEEVFNEIYQGTYQPHGPERVLYRNKGHGVVRRIPVFCIKDYIIYSLWV